MQFRSILLIIYLFTTSLSNAYNKSINAPLDFVGGHSGVGDDLISYAWCDTAEKKIISCGIQNLHGNNYLDGSEVIVDGNTPGGFKCMAQNGYANGGSVIARAACSDPNNLDPTKLHCSYEYSEPEWSSTCNDCTTTVSCPDNKIMVSCSIRSNDASIDGVYIGTKNQQHHITSSTVCTAQNNGSPDPTGPGGVWAQAVCCEYEDYGYELDCKTKWSALNSGWLTVTCDDGYDLMGCSGTGDFNSLTSYYISENKCLAYGMPENGPNLRAVATCCRLYKAPTPSPTVNPTSETLDPTNSPSTAPTSPPSVSPSMSPTSPPTLSPSMSPTDCNEYKNETSNDGFEETIDDIISEIKFINIITNENKTFNVLETAEYTANTKRLPAFENDIFQQLSCFGDVSCLKSTIAFSNNSICNLLCDQFLSCMAADVTIGQCKEVSIICNGQQSCDGMIVDINSTGIDNGSIIIECGIKSSCNNMVIDIIGNQNVVTNISCYAPNACDNIDITVEDHTLSTLKMYSYSDNAIFDNGVGLQESAGGRKLIQCNEKSKYIRWNKTLTNAEMRTLIKKEYSNNVFPCDNLQIKCAADENDTKSTAHCDINYNVTDPTITNPSTECYWIPVSEIVQLDCIGKCFTSPTASPTPAPTGTPTEPSINPTNAPTDIPTSTPSAAPTSPPTNIPSTAPTTAPTLSPTISPVYSPSISPTISPTLLPTISPTISPSLPPSKVPTLAPSVAPTRDPTEDVDDIFDMYIPITYKIQNLTRDNIDDIIYNPGLIIEEIREIIEQYFYFDEETLKYKDFWLEIEAVNEKNIFNGDILEGGDLGYRSLEKPLLLESKIETDRLSSGTVIKRSDSDKFRENTQKQLQFFFNNNTDLYFEVRNPSELKSLEKFPSKPPDDATVIILSTVIIGLGALCSLAAFIVNKKGGTKVDNSAFYVPILVALNIYDFISDVNLSVQILQNANPTVKDIVFLLGLASIAFIIIPFGSNLYYAMRINHQKVIRQNSSARVWFSKHLAPFILLCVASAGTYPVLSLSSSRLFGLDFFNAGLMSSDLHKLQKIKIRSSITLENAPQLVIQVIYSIVIGRLENATILAFVASSLSIIASVVVYTAQKDQMAIDEFIISKYYIRFAQKQGENAITSEQNESILQNKGLKMKLGENLSSVFKIPNKSIEIGFVTPNRNGCIIHLQHSIFKDDMNSLKQKIFSQQMHPMNEGYNIQITPQLYISNLYESYANDINEVLSDHFSFDHTKFISTYHKTYDSANDIQTSGRTSSAFEENKNHEKNILDTIANNITLSQTKRYSSVPLDDIDEQKDGIQVEMTTIHSNHHGDNTIVHPNDPMSFQSKFASLETKIERIEQLLLNQSVQSAPHNKQKDKEIQELVMEELIQLENVQRSTAM
eukprot:520717_1